MKPLAEKAAKLVTDSFRLDAPPVDIRSLAECLGVNAIEYADLVEDGRLQRVNGKSRILVRRGLSAERARFTIAHELAHLILSDPSSDLVARRHRIGHDQEERFCEDFAAALLLPRDWVRKTATGRPKTLHTLRVVAGRSNTSLAAACVRLNEVAGWRLTLMHWRLADQRWGFRWAAALPPGSVGRIRSIDGTRQVIEMASRQGGDTQVQLPLRFANADHDIDAQISVRHGSALVLAKLGPSMPKKPGGDTRAHQRDFGRHR